MPGPRVAVVILNYNGTSLLRQFLPSVAQHSEEAAIYLADNASTDDSLRYVAENFPAIKCISLPENYGFAGGYNEALKQVEADYYVLLNSDVEVTANWIQPVITMMESDRQIAAVQPKILSYSEKHSFEYAGACGGFIDKYVYPFCRGRMFNDLEKDSGQYNDAREIFWATGACMFVRADAYHELSGFDAAFFAHMEEIDLCWRMKNTGRKIYVQPLSVVYHLGGGTLNKISPRKTYLNFRNNLVTMTKNYPGAWFGILLARLVLDGIAGMKFLFEGRGLHTWAVIRAHFSYYLWLPRVLRQRRTMRKLAAFKASRSCIYNGNVVSDYYLSGKKKFSELESGRFSA